jgi:hypothetical protein
VEYLAAPEELVNVNESTEIKKIYFENKNNDDFEF